MRWRPFAVIGAGPAGSAAAATLARLGRRVVVLDAGPRGSHHQIGESLPAAGRLLRALGLWDRLVADGHERSSTAWRRVVDSSIGFALPSCGLVGG